jgi:insulysin
MLFEPLETYPEKSLVLQEFDEPMVKRFITYLRPENSFYVLTAQPEQTGIPLDKKEQWLGAEYSVQPLKPESITAWQQATAQQDLQIPTPNPFVPKSMHLVDSNTPKTASNGLLIRPEAVLDDPARGLVYFASDDRYKVPEIQWILNIKTPLVDLSDPETIVLADLYTRAVKESLNTYAYPATMAGLSFSVNRGENGIVVTVNGYSENAYALLSEIFTTLQKTSPTQEQFDTYKESLTRSYRNFRKESPLAIGNEVMQSVIYRNFTTARDKAKAIATVSYSDFLRYTETIFSQSYLEAMLFGNMTKSDALKIWDGYRVLIARDSYPRFRHSKREVILLPEDKGPFFLERPAQQTGNAAILTVQNGPYTFESRASQQVLGKLLEEPFFSELRTRQQTGYIVFSSAQEIERQLFILFAVQSATHDTRDLLARYEQFIEEFLNQIENDPAMQERFDTVRASLANQLSQPPKNLQEMAATLNLLAFDYDADFDFLNKRISSFEELSYEQFLENAHRYLGRSNRRRLATLIRGNTEENMLRYRRAKTPNNLRQASNFVTADSVE